MKKFITILSLILLLLIPCLNVYALNEQDYKFDVIFDNGKTQFMQGTSFQKQFIDVIRISVFNSAINIQQGQTYKLYMTYTYESNHGYVALDTNRLYVGNYSWNQWTLTTPTWLNLDKQTDLGNGHYLLEYGVVLEFTSTFTSNGLSQDFYFNDFPTLYGFVINRFDIECTSCSGSGSGGGDSNTDFSDLINSNNQNTQNIINNQNQNTQNIINNQNQNNNALLEKQEENINAIKDLTKQEQENNKNLEDINNTINDDSDVDFDDSYFDEYRGASSPVSSLLTMPLTLLDKYLQGFDGNCSNFNLGTLYGTQLSMPCIQPENYLGSNLWSLIDSLFSIFMCYQIGMLGISIYESLTELDDGMQDLYTPQHALKSRVNRGESEGLY